MADRVEGAVNLVHGLPEWAVTLTLIRDNVPVLTVVHQPIGDRTWTASRGGGAYLDGVRLRVSGKTDLDAAIVTASQAGGATTRRRPTPRCGPAAARSSTPRS